MISLGKSAEEDLEVVEEEAALLDPPQLQLSQQKTGARLFTQLPQASYREKHRYLNIHKYLNYDFTADPDPAFHSNADPDPASKNNADPNPDPQT